MIHNRSSFVNRTRFQTKMGKVYDYPFSDQNGAKTLPFGATHTYMAYIREYPLNVTSLKWSSLITFDDFRDPHPPLNPSKDFSDPPFWVLSYDRPPPPSPLLFSNSASFSTKGIKLDIICFYRARLLCETAHRGTTRNLRNRRNLKKKWLFLLQIPLANMRKQLVTIHGIIDRLFTDPYYQQRSSRSSAHRLGAIL